jgi:hypothetical protein
LSGALRASSRRALPPLYVKAQCPVVEERVLQGGALAFAVDHVVLLGRGTRTREQGEENGLPDAVGAQDLLQGGSVGFGQPGLGG